MSMMQYWQEQRALLTNVITAQTPLADAVRHLRHALLQTEQNALAAISDDTLRQQAGVLTNCLKGSLHLLETTAAGKAWVSLKERHSKKTNSSFLLCALAAIGLLIVWCILKGYWGLTVLAGVALSAAFAGYIADKKQRSSFPVDDNIQVSVGVSPERLFSVLDAQITAIDRYLDDFAYLNSQARGDGKNADPVLLSRASELLEALGDCDEETRCAAEDAANQLLSKLGMRAVLYTEENSRLFNILPSKSLTRTLSPAIIATDDQRLLRRGTAAVRIDAAG